jgi:hypothetical protein
MEVLWSCLQKIWTKRMRGLKEWFSKLVFLKKTRDRQYMSVAVEFDTFVDIESNIVGNGIQGERVAIGLG